jgi:acetyltransferase-like isoleucine patch superfamily enzyme
VRQREGVRIHPTADVADSAEIGPGTSIWNHAQVREDARIGGRCSVGTGAYIDFGVELGDRCKLQNGVFVYHGYTLEAGVFLGPGAMLLNDLRPRAINPDGTLKGAEDWTVAQGRVRMGAAVGGGAVLLPGVTVGCWALVGAGAVVTRDVADHALVYGNPAREAGFVCFCGRRLAGSSGALRCECGRTVELA